MPADPPIPQVSVVVPTYRRHDLLPRALESVLAQTIAHWELIVSDDETAPNPSRTYAQGLASRDQRIRVVVNPGPEHSQSANHNHAFTHARAPWIKILHSDDALEPECLERMLHAASLRPAASLCACLIRPFVHDRPVDRHDTRARRPRVVAMPGRAAQLAMCLQDIDIGAPSALMVRRQTVERGARFSVRPDIRACVDTLFTFDALDHGDLVIVREPLARWHAGDHESETTLAGGVPFAELDILRREFLERLDPSLRPPSLGVARGQSAAIRAAHALARGQFGEGLRLLASATHPRSWALAARWALRRRFPGLTILPREVLER